MKSSTKIEANGSASQAAGRDIINQINLPRSFVFDTKNLAELIDELSEEINTEVDPDSDFLKIDIDEKNIKNKLPKEFYEQCIKEEIEYFGSIDSFLKNPKYEKYKIKFNSIVKCLKPKVEDALENGVPMSSILANLFDYFYESKEKIKEGNDKYIVVLSYYIYHNCYIGRK